MKRPFTNEEFEALNKDLNEVLIKHNAEMSVKSTIELFKVEDDESGDKTEEKSDAPPNQGG